MDAFTENLIKEFIGFDNDCEFFSDTCSDEEKGIKKTKGINQDVYFWV